MQRQLFIGGKKLAAFLFQKPFRRQPRAPFLRQTFRKIHAALPTSCLPVRPADACTSGFRD